MSTQVNLLLIIAVHSSSTQNILVPPFGPYGSRRVAYWLCRAWRDQSQSSKFVGNCLTLDCEPFVKNWKTIRNCIMTPTIQKIMGMRLPGFNCLVNKRESSSRWDFSSNICDQLSFFYSAKSIRRAFSLSMFYPKIQ